MTQTSQCTLEATHVDYLRAVPPKVEALGMHGLDDIVRACVVALASGGHVLLESNPGLGKTALVRALSQALGLGRGAVGRVQFTPDLMPADITGTLMPHEDGSGRLEFRKGPIFCNLLLADEINRATAKTQSAMLEAMAEYQVTVLGQTYPLRAEKIVGRSIYMTPFMVLATQNPIDQDGTHSLPEAQSDRFMFKLNMPMPSAENLRKILQKELNPSAARSMRPQAPSQDLEHAEAFATLHDVVEALQSVELPMQVSRHISNMIQASNQQFDQVEGISAAGIRNLQAEAAKIIYPLGTRAAIALGKGAVAWAAAVLVPPYEASIRVGAETPRALAQILVPCLRHRLKILHDYHSTTTPEAEAQALEAFIRNFAKLCAPEQDGYAPLFRNALDEAARSIRL